MIHCWLALPVLHTFVLGQAAGKPEFLGTENGLSQTINAYIYQSRNGMVWISSVDGLNRFDGRNIKVFRPDKTDSTAVAGANIQSAFFEDATGNIWFSTEAGFSVYRQKTGNFQNFQITQKEAGDHVCYAFFLEQRRHLWFLNNFNIYRFDTQKKGAVPELVEKNLYAVRFAADTTFSGKLHRIYAAPWDFKNGFEVLYVDTTGKCTGREYFDLVTQQYKKGLKTTQILPESDTLIWLVSGGNLIGFNPLHPKQFKTYPAPGKQKASFSFVTPFKQRFFLTATTRGDFFYFDKFLKKFQPAPELNLPESTGQETIIDHLYISPGDIIWRSVRGKGIYYNALKNKAFTTLNTTDPVKNFFPENDQSVTLLGDHTSTTTASYCIQKTVPFSPYSKLVRAGRNNLWRFSTEGLWAFNLKTSAWEFKIKPAESMSFMDVTIAPNNLMVVATLSGVLTIDLSTLTTTLISNEPAYSLGKDKNGYIWQGGSDQISIWKPDEKNGLQIYSRIEQTAEVNAFLQDQTSGRMWVATSRGLRVFNTDSLPGNPVEGVNDPPAEYCYAVAQDKNGYLWVSTNQGIIRFHPYIQTAQFKHFTTRDGLSGNEFYPGAVLKDAQDYIWFGSTKGVTVFHPDSIADIGHAPQLAITALHIHDREWRGDTAIEMLHQINLPYNQNTLRLQLAAMEYLHPGDNQFRVMLQSGSEPASWTDLGTQNFVTYANLRPGQYTFRFIACNAEGIWVDEKDAQILQIHIHPHWSNTWWFRTLAAAIALALVAVVTAFFYRYRLRAKQLELEKAERERIELEKNAVTADSLRQLAESEMKLLRSQLNPHFLFNAMNSINRYILTNEKDKASEYLGQFAQLTRSILDNSRHLRISLADELKMLEQYLALENHRFEQQITWTFRISEEVDVEILLVPSMVLQPFAENAVLHGLAPKNGGHIDIDISRNGDHLQCCITDNGVGRQTSVISTTPRHASAGMRLITERIDAFAALEGQSANVEITDLKDATGAPTGTSVIIQLPWVEAV